MNPNVFRSYDIRGLSPGEIDEPFARRLGKALAELYQPKRVVVGYDMRATSMSLEEALVEGLVVLGVDVVRIGLCSTPMFYFAMTETDGAYDLGVMVTASHNPAVYNGFKLQLGNGLSIDFGGGMEQIRDRVLSDMPLLDRVRAGTITRDEGLLERYVERIWNVSGLPSLRCAWRLMRETEWVGLFFRRLSRNHADWRC